MDAGGDIVLTGSFLGTIDFGSGNTLTNPGGASQIIFLAKLSPLGSPLWSKSFANGSTTNGVGLGLAVDGSGNVVLTGQINGAVDFGGGSLGVGQSAYAAKFSSGGTHLWSQAFSGTSNTTGFGIATDANGNVGLVGGFAGSLNTGQVTLTSAGSMDGLVLKLGP